MSQENIRYMLVSTIKILLVIIGTMLLFIIGIAIGYSAIGKGSFVDVFNGKIWEHIFSFFR